MIYPNGSIAIIGRVKEQFKLSQGEYVAPAKLENAYGLSNLIGQCFVFGDSRKSNTVMIVVIDEET
jgi:long-chain acyl-CoA synthetase